MVNVVASIVDNLEPVSNSKFNKFKGCYRCGKRYKTEPEFKVHMRMRQSRINPSQSCRYYFFFLPKPSLLTKLKKLAAFWQKSTDLEFPNFKFLCFLSFQVTNYRGAMLFRGLEFSSDHMCISGFSTKKNSLLFLGESLGISHVFLALEAAGDSLAQFKRAP
jgi:hypothetical protein